MKRKKVKILSTLAICAIAICSGFTAYNFQKGDNSIFKHEVKAETETLTEKESSTEDDSLTNGEWEWDEAINGWVYIERKSPSSIWDRLWNLWD